MALGHKLIEKKLNLVNYAMNHFFVNSLMDSCSQNLSALLARYSQNLHYQDPEGDLVIKDEESKTIFFSSVYKNFSQRSNSTQLLGVMDFWKNSSSFRMT